MFSRRRPRRQLCWPRTGENDSPWAAINAVTHIVDGEEKEQPTGYAPRESGIGVGINGTAMAAWGVLYEGALLLTGAKSTLLTGGLASLAAWVIDYKIVPRRLAPGIETRLSSEAVWAAYAAMAIGFALSPAWNKDKQR